MIDRVALFVTCLADTLFPEVGKGDRDGARAAGHRGRLPAGADLLRPDAPRTPATRARPERSRDASSRSSTASTRSSRRPGRAPATCGRTCRSSLGGVDRGVPAATWELSQLLVGRLGVEDVGSGFEGSIAYHPTCHSLRLLGVGDAPERLLARRARGRAARAARGRGVLRLRRHLRGEERRRLGRDARREARERRSRIGADAVCACDSSCLMHIGGGLERRGAVRAPAAPRGDARVVSAGRRPGRRSP